jgi:hypothetical protein
MIWELEKDNCQLQQLSMSKITNSLNAKSLIVFLTELDGA